MDEFDLSLHYIEGKKNVLADCFSRLPIMRSIPVENNPNNSKNKRTRIGTPMDFHTIKVPKDDTMINDESFFTLDELFVNDERINCNSNAYFNIDEDQEIMDLFLNLPFEGEMQNPINIQNIANHQQQDAELHQQQKQPTALPKTFYSYSREFERRGLFHSHFMLLHRESRRGESKEFPESLAMGK